MWQTNTLACLIVYVPTLQRTELGNLYFILVVFFYIFDLVGPNKQMHMKMTGTFAGSFNTIPNEVSAPNWVFVGLFCFFSSRHLLLALCSPPRWNSLQPSGCALLFLFCRKHQIWVSTQLEAWPCEVAAIQTTVAPPVSDTEPLTRLYFTALDCVFCSGLEIVVGEL